MKESLKFFEWEKLSAKGGKENDTPWPYTFLLRNEIGLVVSE